MAHTSMVTLLGRLEVKGLVRRAKGPVGKAFVYTPTRRPGGMYRRVVGDVLQRIFRGNGPALVAARCLRPSRRRPPRWRNYIDF